MASAVVVAGGLGQRLKSRVRKPFVPLAGKPMLAWTLQAFEKSPGVRAVVVVAHPADLAQVGRLIRSHRIKKVIQVVGGGKSRSDSVFEGLQALGDKVRWVAIHDGARPLVTPNLIRSVLRQAYRHRAAVAAVPVVPTVKEVKSGWITRTLDRSRLWAIQTPQAFRLDLIRRAHEQGRLKGLKPTDDAALVEALGHRVRVAAGSFANIKVTTPEDLLMAEALLKRRKAAG